ncbi:TD and POZ domain-containing protein 4 [Argiope bruennichi]|uniref:TD and POZ domain-containing protein 4 n=1 Tax=Argiope bruennichi TaxID=94029 RepID=A0A8T0EED0_ARGBR|nr:TD and POZ domain-containing protein 4 [Argiope bruennichi]
MVLWKWRLCLSPAEGLQNEFICLAITHEKTSDVLKNNNLDYCFSVSSDHPSLPPFEVASSQEFFDYLGRPCLYVPKDRVFKLKAGIFIPSDTIIIKSKVWKREESASEDGKCMIITIAQVEQLSFGCVVENFSDLAFYRKTDVRIRSASVVKPVTSMNINLTNGEIIFIEIIPWDYEKIECCKCALNLLDGSGNETECGYDELSFFNIKQQCSLKIPLQFSKKNLMESHKQYLQNNCLSLQCDIAIYTGKYKSKIIKTKYAANLSNIIEQPISGVQSGNEVLKEENQVPSTMQEDMMSLFSSGILSDIKLQTATETFRAHKLILSLWSPVFNDLFANMEHKINDCVQIKDLDAETMRRFLLFLYSDNLTNLNMEIAKKLYFAGEKYEVLELKCKGSNFLQKNICLSNCCVILMLANNYNDSDLKKAVQEFIAVNGREILQSDQWKLLKETNTNLAFETISIMYKINRKYSWNGIVFSYL